MMDKVIIVKQEIRKLIANYLGEPTAKTFFGFYNDETLPIYSDAAVKILRDFIGEEKAKNELKTIFIRNHTAHTYV
ncbi:MAG TPA: hypothetical protein VLF89_08370 [Candidatus Saccharimonadales bacterium]|nr:hypothetical protein [Candidatus Saccharimonadales bacterium]